MTLREQWLGLPVDAAWSYCAVAGYIASLGLVFFAGPVLVAMLIPMLILLLLVIIGFVLTCRLVAGSAIRQTIVPLVLVFVCVATVVIGPTRLCVEAHVVMRVYLAGGPKVISEWAQGLLDSRENTPRGMEKIDVNLIPSNVRMYLPGSVYVYQADRPIVRIEMGGGFFHFGVVVLPQETPAEPELWQRWLGWPPQVVVYAGD